MQIKIENLKEKCELHFSAVVEGDEWKDAQQKAMVSLAKNVTVKGFRKGKAPLAQAMRYVNPTDVMNNAADKAVQKAFNEMVEKNNIRPFIQPELVVEEFKADKLAFKFVVINTPTVEVGEYKGLTVEKLDTTVTEADIDNELKALAVKNAELVVLEENEEAALGDTVVIDFKGFVEGEAFDGGEASSYELVLGSGVFVPGFENQLVGVKTNEDRDVNITFPENYVADLSNKQAKFEVHVNAIKRKVVPAIDEDLVAELDIEGVDTLEQLRAHLSTQIQTRKERNAEQTSVNTLLDKIAEGSKLFCHNTILKNDAKKIVNDFTSRLTQQGFTVEDYLNMSKRTMEDLENDAMVEASKNTMRAYLFEAIAVKEHINVTPAELDEKLAQLAEQYKITVEEVKKQIGDRINAFAFNMKQDKVVKFLKENNNI